MSDIKVNFDYFDLLSILGIAERRNIIKQVYGVKSQRYDKNQTDFLTHINGVMGEAAVARFLNIKLDKNISLSGDDKIKDLVKDNKTIQVKTSIKEQNKHLLFNDKSLFKADLAVFASVISITETIIRGWITKEEFLNKAEPKDFGYGQRWTIPFDKLNNPNKLKEYFGAK
jgi:hypothetical protein